MPSTSPNPTAIFIVIGVGSVNDWAKKSATCWTTEVNPVGALPTELS
jgi:hypothetical protein